MIWAIAYPNHYKTIAIQIITSQGDR